MRVAVPASLSDKSGPQEDYVKRARKLADLANGIEAESAAGRIQASKTRTRKNARTSPAESARNRQSQ